MQTRKKFIFIIVALIIILAGSGLAFYFTRLAKQNQNPAASKPVQENLSITAEIPDEASGLIIVRQGVDGEEYARELANKKKWDFIAVETSDYQQVKNIINEAYQKNLFKYLLLIGTNDEIPYAVYNTQVPVYNSTVSSFRTDPALYADVNNDGLAELAVGRLPFSTQNQLEKYFTDLGPKGNVITFDHYPFVVEKDDPSDSFSVMDYSYAKSCIAPLSPSIKVFKMADPATLVQHYYDSTVLELRTHGSDEGIYPTTTIGQWPTPITFTNFRDENGNIRYFKNRPIIVHMSCNNAKILGQQFIENGASAFIGFYNPAGYAPMATQQLLAGKTVGETLKDMYNVVILRQATPRYWDPELKIYQEGTSMSFITNGFNNFDLTDKSVLKTMPEDIYGFMLYGDPSLKLDSSLLKKSSITTDFSNKKLTIEASPVNKFPSTPEFDLLCYTGAAISDPSFILKEMWSKSHDFTLVFPVQNINKLLSYSIYVGGQKINPGERRGIASENVNINLAKGKIEEYVFVTVSDSGGVEGRPDSRFDYSKDFRIEIQYQ